MAGSRYNDAVMERRLAVFLKAMDWRGLTVCLDGLSNKDFRMAGIVLGERLLPEVEDSVFWAAFHALVSYQSKAFLVTALKAVPLRKQRGGFTLRHGGFLLLADYLNRGGTELDRSKFIRFMLGVFADEVEELEYLFRTLCVDDVKRQMEYLLQGDGVACAYLLFQTMRRTEHDKDLLARCCRLLMRKGDSLSFNLASLCKVYFDLPEVKGTFSLHLSPFQLGRLETSYENFRKVLQGI